MLSGGHHHSHEKGVGAVVVRVPGDLELLPLERFLGSLLWDRSDAERIYRCKGVVSIKGEARKFVLQAVHELFEVTESREDWSTGEERCSKVAFIGRMLDKRALEEGLAKCRAGGALQA